LVVASTDLVGLEMLDGERVFADSLGFDHVIDGM
jgi:hypothetical protein